MIRRACVSFPTLICKNGGSISLINLTFCTYLLLKGLYIESSVLSRLHVAIGCCGRMTARLEELVLVFLHLSAGIMFFTTNLTVYSSIELRLEGFSLSLSRFLLCILVAPVDVNKT